MLSPTEDNERQNASKKLGFSWIKKAKFDLDNKSEQYHLYYNSKIKV